MENLKWIKKNVRIFIDQNIMSSVKEYLLSKGYKNVDSVYTLKLSRRGHRIPGSKQTDHLPE